MLRPGPEGQSSAVKRLPALHRYPAFTTCERLVHDQAALDVGVCPVMQPLASEARKIAVPARSFVSCIRRNVLFVLEEFGAVIGVHRRVDRARRDGIDPDPLRHDILRGSARKAL
jgi:hypothetical protein